MKGAKSKCLVLITAFLLLIAVICTSGGFATAAENEQVIKVTAKRFSYTPNVITVKKGIPVVLQFTSLDRLHGFNCSALDIRSDIPPGKVTELRFVPQKAGTFPFHCDNFCGTGHDGMTGKIVVTE